MKTVTCLQDVAEEVARAMSYPKVTNEAALVVTPLLYPGGARVVARIADSESGYLVSDYGAARREAELMNGGRIFGRVAQDAAERFGVRFDSDMYFDIDVPREALVTAVIAVANASKVAVDSTAERMSERRASDQRHQLWSKLERTFMAAAVARDIQVRGSSSVWNFDAAVMINDRRALFELVVPHNNAVTATVAKFLDVRDLGVEAPARVAVLTDKEETPHIPLLGRTATIISLGDRLQKYKEAA